MCALSCACFLYCLVMRIHLHIGTHSERLHYSAIKFVTFLISCHHERLEGQISWRVRLSNIENQQVSCLSCRAECNTCQQHLPKWLWRKVCTEAGAMPGHVCWEHLWTPVAQHYHACISACASCGLVWQTRHSALCDH